MNTIKCGLKLNEYHTVPATGITPAEVLILAAIHCADANEGKIIGDPRNPGIYPVIVSPVADGIALTEDVPSVPAEEQKLHPLTGKLIPAVPAIPAKTHKRTDAEEYIRLKNKYTQLVKGVPQKLVLSQLFPGIAPKLPETFEEIGLKVAAPEKADKE